MAIYHLTAKTGSKAKGQSAAAKMDYISREGKYSKDVSEVLGKSSGNMPEWAAADPSQYWKAADQHERANGRLFKELEFALPVELNLEDQAKLAKEFADHVTASEKLPYSLAIHAGKGSNPHCHLMISERQNDGLRRAGDQWFRRYNPKQPEKGGARKTESLKPSEWLESTREDWARLANQALKRSGEKSRIDHRSLADQGIDRIPSVHLGPNVVEMEAKGIRTRRASKALTAERQQHDRTRQDQISQIERGTGGRRGTNSPANGHDRGRDATQPREASGPFKRLWARFGTDRGPKEPREVQRAQGAVYWAVSRLSSLSGRGDSSSSVIQSLAANLSERASQRRRAAEQRELERDRQKHQRLESIRSRTRARQAGMGVKGRGDGGMSL